MRYATETSHSLDGKLAALHENQLIEFSGSEVFKSIDSPPELATTMSCQRSATYRCPVSKASRATIFQPWRQAPVAIDIAGEVADLPYHRNVHLRRPTITAEAVSNNILRGPRRRTFSPCTVC